jgi:hypothetical protein
MDEEFRKERAMTVRAMAEKADPFTKKRLLELAAKHARAQRPPTQIDATAVRAFLLGACWKEGPLAETVSGLPRENNPAEFEAGAISRKGLAI